MQLRRTLVAAAILLAAGASASQAQDRVQPESAQPRLTFKVTVTADQQIVDNVYEYMTRVERRNAARSLLGSMSASPELELVRLIANPNHVKLPAYQRDPGNVYLRLNQEAGTAAVEYCLGKCESNNPELATYRTTIQAFTKELEQATRKLAKYRAR